MLLVSPASALFGLGRKKKREEEERAKAQAEAVKVDPVDAVNMGMENLMKTMSDPNTMKETMKMMQDPGT